MNKKAFIVLLWAILVVTCSFSSTLAAAAAQPGTTSLVVKLTSGLTPDQQAQVIARNGGVEKSKVEVLRIHTVLVPDADLAPVLQAYQADPQVERVEADKTRKAEGVPSDAEAGGQWSLSRIGWNDVFGRVTPSGSATIALLDTGVDGTHPDLATVVVPGTSLIDGSDGLSDPNGHGTYLAGIAAAATDNGIGIAGVAYQGVRIMPVSVLGAGGTGQDSDIIAGIVWAADHGADVILMGFSNPEFSQNLQDAVDYAWAKGAVLVAATGNDGVATPTFPAGNRAVVGVSATDESDFLVFDSNYGPDTFLSAPGANIYTTAPGGTYRFIGGTSASSAIVAGVAAFLKAVDPTLANGVIVARLARGALAIGTAGDPENQSRFGNGQVNLAGALADTSSDPVQPAGVAPGNGGPFLGPYTAAADGSITQKTGQSNSLNYGSAAAAKYVYSFVMGGSGTVALSCSGLPAHAVCFFSQLGLDPGANVSLTVSTAANTPAYNGPFTITATQAGHSWNCSSNLTINPKPLSMSGLSVPASKEYDGSTAAAVSGTAALMVAKAFGVGTFADGAPYTGDNVSIAGTPSGNYNSRDVALATSVNYTGLTLFGTQAGNYTLTLQGPSAASILPKTVTVSGLGAGDKPYDGNTGAAVTGTGNLNGVVAGDAVTLSGTPTGTFSDPAVAAAKSVAIGGLYLTGASAGNYRLQAPTATAAITKAVPAVTTWPAAGSIRSGQPLSLSILTGGSSPVAGSFAFTNPATLPAAGSYLAPVTFTPADLSSYLPVTGQVTVTVAAALQSISFPQPADSSFGAAPFAVSALASSGLPVSFSSLTPAVCSVSGNSVALVGAGTCTLAATQAGSADFEPAAQVQQSFTVAKGNQAAVTLSAPANAVYGAARLYAVAGGGSGTGAYLYGAGASTACSVDSATGLLTMLSGTGTCSLTATRAGDGNYNGSAPSPAAVVTTGKASQVLSFPPVSGKGSNDPPFALAATSSSGLPVAFSIVSGPATVAGNLVTITGPGTIVARASQAGNGNYNAASSVDASIPVTAVVACGTPGNLIVPATNSSGIITLNWTNSTAGATYLLEQSVNGGPWNQVSAGPGSPAGVVATVMGNYAFRVKATKTGYADSAYATGATVCAVTLGAPSNLIVPATNTSGGITLYWTNNTAGANYLLEQSVNGGAWVQIYSGPSSPATVPANVMGSYSYRVKATKAGFADSAYATGATICVSTLGAPSNLVVPATNTSGTITLYWNNNTVGATYVLEQSVNGGAWSQVYSGPASPAGVPATVMGNYSFRVKATKAGFADSAYATSATVCYASLGAPTNLAVPATNTSGTITIYWNNNTAGSTYVLEQSINGGAWSQAYSGPASPAGVTAAVMGNYAFRVKATKAGFTDSAYATSATVCAATLGAPSTLVVPATNSSGIITLYWNNSTLGANYILEQSIDGGPWSQVYSGPASPAGVVATVMGNYSYRVKATKAGFADSAYLTGANVCVATLGAPSTLVVPATNSSGLITLYWNNNTLGANYVLEQSVNGGAWSQVYSGPASPAGVTASVMGNYAFRVKATKAGFTDSAYATSATVCTATLGAPSTLVVPATNSNGTITLYWNNNTLGANYVLEQSINGGAWSRVYSGPASPAGVVATVMGNYAFRVKAAKPGFADSAYATSATVCVVTLGAPSTLVVPATNSSGTVTLYWNNNTLGANYLVEQSFNGGAWTQVYSGPASPAGVAVKAIGSYAYRVKATKAGFADSAYATSTTVCAVTVAH
jgi:subtilisin family serine protease